MVELDTPGARAMQERLEVEDSIAKIERLEREAEQAEYDEIIGMWKLPVPGDPDDELIRTSNGWLGRRKRS